MSLSQQISIKKAISQAKNATRLGNFDLAIQLYQSVLQHQPRHPIAQKAIRKLQKSKPHSVATKTQSANPSKRKIEALLDLYNSGAMPETEQACRKLLQSFPSSLTLCNVLGASLKVQGKLTEALHAFEKTINLKPDYAEAYSNRGVVLQELGQPENAVQSYDQAIQIKPDYGEAFYNRGISLQTMGQLNEAIKSYTQAIKFKSDYAVAFYHRANTLKELERFDEAIENYTRAIEINPGYGEAFYNRGSTYQEMGQPKEALANFNRLIKLYPNYADAFYRRGTIFQEIGQLKEAIASYNQAIKLKPNYAVVYNNIGVAHYELGQLHEAIENYKQAIESKPDYAEAYYNCGIVLQSQGNLSEASASYEKALKIKPDYPEAHYNLSSLKKYRPNDPQTGLMEKLHTKLTTDDPRRTQLCFALAKAYGDLNEYDKCFNLLEEGNCHRKHEDKYYFDNHQLLINAVKEIFAGEIKTLNLQLDNSMVKNPIFIVGMPRSGTSLAEQILVSHSKVHGAGELDALSRLIWPILSSHCNHKINRNNNNLSIKQLDTIYKGYLTALTALNVPERIITDKMPLNFQWIGFILATFPKSKIINLNRDPIATCWSIFKHYFTAKGNGYAYDLGDLAKFHNLYTDLMSFWRHRFPNAFYDLHYEKLTENQETETRKLLKFCDLEWEEKCLSFHKTKRSIKTASAAQVRKKMYTGSSGAWKKYEKHLQPLLANLISCDPFTNNTD